MASQFNSSGISTVNIISERSGSFAFLPPGVPSASFFESRSNIDAFLEASASVILELEPTTGKHLQFRIPSGAISTSEDAIPFFISKSFAPKIGIGTNTPLSTLDIVDVEDTADGFTFLIRNARTSTEGGQLGDAAGTINFIVTSGSYNNVTTSGSVGKITSKVTAIDNEGAAGELKFEVADKNNPKLDTTQVFSLQKDSSDSTNVVASITGSAYVTKVLYASQSEFEDRVWARSLLIKATGGSEYPGDNNAKIQGTLDVGNITTTSITASVISASGGITGSDVNITGFPSVSASLAAAGDGNVSNTGTPVNNQVAVWTNSTTIEGDADFTWSGTILTIDGSTKTRLTAVANDGIGGTVNAAGEFGYGAEVWQGPGINDTPSSGSIYYLTSGGTMALASSGSATAATGFISYATDASSVNGMVLRGFVYVGNLGQSVGDKMYLADNGTITPTLPSTSTHFVRIVGYASHINGIIYFNPSNDYIQLA